MSVIYKGSASQLIIAPGDRYTEATNGLVTLERSYQCASSHVSTAANELSVGSTPNDYPALQLFTKTKTTTGAVTEFSCVYTGKTSSQKVTLEKELKSYSKFIALTFPSPWSPGQTITSNFPITGQCLSPVRTISYTADTGSPPIQAPEDISDPIVISAYGGPVDSNLSIELVDLSPFSVYISSYKTTNYGSVEVVECSFAVNFR
jgi:hypothetical protein